MVGCKFICYVLKEVEAFHFPPILSIWISFFLFFFFCLFFIYRCVLSLVETTALLFKEAPKSLNFLSKCNVKKIACMEARERYIKSKVNGEYNVRQF